MNVRSALDSYEWETIIPLPSCPSPKFQAYSVMTPSEECDPEALNVTINGEGPEFEDRMNEAVGNNVERIHPLARSVKDRRRVTDSRFFMVTAG